MPGNSARTARSESHGPAIGTRDADFAGMLFERLRRETPDLAGGVRRESFGAGEQRAADIFSEAAASLDLERHTDAGGNLHLSLPGAAQDEPGWLTGSHLDSVPQGGNFDGAAGIVAGLTLAAAYRREGRLPPRRITVIGVRAEEASSWYRGRHRSHLGSRAALGLLDEREMNEAVSLVSGRTLAADLAGIGLDPAAISRGGSRLSPQDHCGFVELHIEQGPILEAMETPVGIVSGIRGSARMRDACCIGEYTHSGAVPRAYRRDAVLATAELCHAIEQAWDRHLNAGRDLVCTVGKFSTNPQAHSLSKVPGEVAFTLDFRSLDADLLREMVDGTGTLAGEIGERRGVRFELGECNLSAPTAMDPDLVRLLAQGAGDLGIPHIAMASGAGHDAQEFERAGFRTAMIFVRNACGSHNPRESMDIADFLEGVRLLGWLLGHDR